MAEAIIPLGHQGSNINIPYDEIKFFSKTSTNIASFTVSLSISSFSYIIIQIFNASNTITNFHYYEFSPIVMSQDQTYTNVTIGCSRTNQNPSFCADIDSITTNKNTVTFYFNYQPFTFSGYIIACNV